MRMNDARVVKTRKALRDNFLTLLKRMPVSRITVKDICEMCQINRSTFYKHYRDPLDVLEKLEAELLEELRQSLEPPIEDARAFLEQVLAGIEERGDFYMILASPNGDPALPTKIFQCCYQIIFPRFDQNHPDLTPAQREMLFQYLAQGSGGVLSSWMKNGMKEPRENVAALLLRMNSGCLRGTEG